MLERLGARPSYDVAGEDIEPKRAKRVGDGCGRRAAVLLRYNGEVGLTHYAAAVPAEG